MADFTLYRPAIGTVLPGLPPQLAAGGEGPGGVAPLTPAQVSPVLSEAISLWASAGLPAHDVDRLQAVSVEITDLPAGYLGGTVLGGSTIFLSADAAGYGWSTDASRPPSGTNSGQEDLLTVLMHEMGHCLGLDDLDPAADPSDLMTETLATGVRRLPSTRDITSVLELEQTDISESTCATLTDAALEAIGSAVAFSPATVSTEGGEKASLAPNNSSTTSVGTGLTWGRGGTPGGTTGQSNPSWRRWAFLGEPGV